MAECFAPLAHCPRDTLVFLCTKRPDAGALAKGKVRGRHDTEIADALAAANLRLKPWDLGDRLATQARALGRNPRKRRAKDYKNRP